MIRTKMLALLRNPVFGFTQFSRRCFQHARRQHATCDILNIIEFLIFLCSCNQFTPLWFWHTIDMGALFDRT